MAGSPHLCWVYHRAYLYAGWLTPTLVGIVDTVDVYMNISENDGMSMKLSYNETHTHIYICTYWLVVSNIFYFHFMYGMSSQPHWRTPSFFKMVIAPPTSMKCIKWRFVSLEMRDDKSPFCRDGVLWDVYGDLIREFITSFWDSEERKIWRVHWVEPDVATKPVGHEQSSHVSFMFHAIFWGPRSPRPRVNRVNLFLFANFWTSSVGDMVIFSPFWDGIVLNFSKKTQVHTSINGLV